MKTLEAICLILTTALHKHNKIHYLHFLCVHMCVSFVNTIVCNSHFVWLTYQREYRKLRSPLNTLIVVTQVTAWNIVSYRETRVSERNYGRLSLDRGRPQLLNKFLNPNNVQIGPYPPIHPPFWTAMAMLHISVCLRVIYASWTFMNNLHVNVRHCLTSSAHALLSLAYLSHHWSWAHEKKSLCFHIPASRCHSASMTL